MEPIPFVSLFHFYHRFSSSGKKLFQLFFFLLVLSAAAWIWGTLNFDSAGITYITQEDSLPSLHTWMPSENTEHSLANFQARVYSNFTFQLPGFVIPSEGSVWALLFGYCFFWAG